MKSWINKKTVGFVLLILALLLIFFSKTIYTYHLPEVTAAMPQKGKLSKVEVGYGTVEWAKVDSIYIPAEGIVNEVFAFEGEYVEAGQKLFSMKYDRDENDWKIQENENKRKQLEMELQDIENQLKSGSALLDIRQQLAGAEKNLDASAVLYDMGAVSGKELEDARNQVNYLRLKLNDTVYTLQMELQVKNLALDDLSISDAYYKKIQTVHNEEVTITAPSAGMLISSNISRSEKVQKDELAVTVGTGNEYVLECPVSLENNFITTGDVCKLSNSSNQVKGTVSGIVPSGQQKIVRIRFTGDNITAGETFEVLFQKESGTSFVLVPNDAVNQDKDGYYLKQVKRRDGIMGKEYYLERIDIYVGDSDHKNTIVSQGITFFEPVLLSSNKTALTGDVVLLKNAGDFFEK